MQIDRSNTESSQVDSGRFCNLPSPELDLEKQDNPPLLPHEYSDESLSGSGTPEASSITLGILVSNAESHVIHVAPVKEEFSSVDSPEKGYLSRTTSSQEQCWWSFKSLLFMYRHLVSYEEIKQMCDTPRHSCKCVTSGVSSKCRQSTGFGGLNPTFRPRDPERGCFSPLWVAFSILIGGLLLDVLISITLGVSALPANITIGVIVVLGLGTALRVALEFCHEWSFRRVVQRVDSNANLGYHPAL